MSNIQSERRSLNSINSAINKLQAIEARTGTERVAIIQLIAEGKARVRRHTDNIRRLRADNLVRARIRKVVGL